MLLNPLVQGWRKRMVVPFNTHYYLVKRCKAAAFIKKEMQINEENQTKASHGSELGMMHRGVASRQRLQQLGVALLG